VEALAHKTDVPARVKDKVHDTQQSVQVRPKRPCSKYWRAPKYSKPGAGEVAPQAEHLVQQAVDKLPLSVAERIEPLVPRARKATGCADQPR
jgi:hypothetical protein